MEVSLHCSWPAHKAVNDQLLLPAALLPEREPPAPVRYLVPGPKGLESVARCHSDPASALPGRRMYPLYEATLIGLDH
jgi:hypothetical protein